MTPETFIRKHIIDHLTTEGFPPAVARGGADEAIAHYRRSSQSSRKGAMFADCLGVALRWAKHQTPITARKAAKRNVPRQLGLL